MNISDLDYPFPQDLIALEPSQPCRVAMSTVSSVSSACSPSPVPRMGAAAAGVPTSMPQETNLSGLFAAFNAGDVLVVNESKVIPARVFSADEVEVLFLRALSPERWEVLFPAREFRVGDTLTLP